jgi:hypothetical protein
MLVMEVVAVCRLLLDPAKTKVHQSKWMLEQVRPKRAALFS